MITVLVTGRRTSSTVSKALREWEDGGWVESDDVLLEAEEHLLSGLAADAAVDVRFAGEERTCAFFAAPDIGDGVSHKDNAGMVRGRRRELGVGIAIAGEVGPVGELVFHLVEFDGIACGAGILSGEAVRGARDWPIEIGLLTGPGGQAEGGYEQGEQDGAAKHSGASVGEMSICDWQASNASGKSFLHRMGRAGPAGKVSMRRRERFLHIVLETQDYCWRLAGKTGRQ